MVREAAMSCSRGGRGVRGQAAEDITLQKPAEEPRPDKHIPILFPSLPPPALSQVMAPMAKNSWLLPLTLLRGAQNAPGKQLKREA